MNDDFGLLTFLAYALMEIGRFGLNVTAILVLFVLGLVFLARHMGRKGAGA